jgi:hypothetical protein
MHPLVPGSEKHIIWWDGSEGALEPDPNTLALKSAQEEADIGNMERRSARVVPGPSRFLKVDLVIVYLHGWSACR